jgi:hypothetical protein
MTVLKRPEFPGVFLWGAAGRCAYIDRYIDRLRCKSLSSTMKKTQPSMIEPLVEHLPEGPSNRSFGYTVGGILIALMLLRWLFTGSFSLVPSRGRGCGATLVLLAAVAPSVLTVPNRLWMKLGLLLFAIVNPVVMFLIYVTTFVPIGLFMRWRGHDPLAARFDRAGPTYWIDRPPGDDPATMRNQF